MLKKSIALLEETLKINTVENLLKQTLEKNNASQNNKEIEKCIEILEELKVDPLEQLEKLQKNNNQNNVKIIKESWPILANIDPETGLPKEPKIAVPSFSQAKVLIKLLKLTKIIICNIPT